ncbi:hypothetical protein HPB48_006274 [Haemaphysalis longicornis]|uniref:Inositol polyphosphate 1-phosphatase n=1 Tax=Haemaphysalis longicornis TaxID=44386 RepID=A0A9J6G742_HAELO|nr:hypothetical protein HPB48_006274 [Haemaphysalis longicornis]
MDPSLGLLEDELEWSLLLEALVGAAEKGAQLARACRLEEPLFQLLVEEKAGPERNPRFVHDFKTLADVLVQETVRHDLACLVSASKGTRPCSRRRSRLLGSWERVLDGNSVAAAKLAQIVHSNPEVSEDTDLASCPVARVSSLGIWIDPIDSTSEYILGKWGDEEEGSSVVSSGLQCVTVLIGVYDRNTGLPVAGVVNQPFHHLDEHNRPVGRCYWGLTLGAAHRWHSPHLLEDEDGADIVRQRQHHPRVLLSASESASVVQALEAAGCEVRFAAGAGYKLLCVALLRADAYLVTQGTTFRWDTCAPHALLLARNMGLFAAVTDAGVPWCVPAPVCYTEPDEELRDEASGAAVWRNSRCLFACRNSFNSRLVFDALRASCVGTAACPL